MSLELLNENQREIWQYIHNERHTVKEAASHFNKPESIIQAQITRCRSKGLIIDVPGETKISNNVFNAPPGGVRLSHHESGRPSGSPTSNEEVLKETLAAGPAKYDVESMIQEAQEQGAFGDEERNVHPMILMGVTIQFMKLAGGRLHAHQLIEDVYGAIRLQVGETRAESAIESKPFDTSDNSPLAMMEGIVAEMRNNPQFSQPIGR